jgi:hypothetical protein
MKNALIAPMQAPIQYISGWTTDTPPEPIYTSIENSCRVAQVETQTFEVALPLFWTPCEDDVKADQWYYNTADEQIYPVPESAPVPEAQIPNL